MLKNRLKNVLIASVLVSSSLMASSYSYNTVSLLGIEGGYANATADTTYPDAYKTNDTNLVDMGLKIGAETDSYRIFLGARYYYDIDDNFDYLSTYGIDLQYKFNFSPKANFFIGVGGGIANAKLTLDGENFDRTISDGYYNVDVGFNIHVTSGTDIELGARYLEVDAHNIKNDIDFQLNSMVSAYGSVIFKWRMD